MQWGDMNNMLRGFILHSPRYEEAKEKIEALWIGDSPSHKAYCRLLGVNNIKGVMQVWHIVDNTGSTVPTGGTLNTLNKIREEYPTITKEQLLSRLRCYYNENS